MNALHPFRRSRDGEGPADELGAIIRSLVGGGALARYPGPVALIGPDDSLTASNRDSHPLKNWLRDGGSPQFIELVQRARRGDNPSETLPVEIDHGDLMYEFCAMPIGQTGSVLVLGRDVTQPVLLRQALADSRQRFKDLVEIAANFSWETTADGRFAFVSSAGALGHPPDALLGKPARDLCIPGLTGDPALLFETRVRIEHLEIWLRRADGSPACLDASAVPLFGEDGSWRGARGVCRDVSDDQEKDAALAQARARESLITHIIRAMRDELEPTNMLDSAAAAATRAFKAAGCAIYRFVEDRFVIASRYGHVLDTASATQLVGRLKDDPEIVAAEIATRRALAIGTRYRRNVNGAICLWRHWADPVWSNAERELVGELSAQLGIAIEQIAAHETLHRISSTDALTGLLNRRTFFAELPRRLERADGRGRAVAMAYVDLDNFKAVNDIHGHQRGDLALKRVADIILRNSTGDDLVARLGGDEFAICLTDMDFDQALAWGHHLLSVRGALADLSGDITKPLGFSIGIAVYEPGSGEQVADLVARADATMYEVKRAGKGTVRLAAPAVAR